MGDINKLAGATSEIRRDLYGLQQLLLLEVSRLILSIGRCSVEDILHSDPVDGAYARD